ncbi:MAG TPA: glycosyltransferase family A protein [Terracidiphilus sp.]|jgi:glycosyltransferase involved in cell wall biosynthesis
MAEVSVVICTRKRPVLLKRCLTAVARLNPAPTHIILVVDNSKGDKDTEDVAREFGARYIIEPKPGLNRARSRGLAECETEFVAFLDDDVVPAPNWLGTLLASSAQGKATGSTGKILNIEPRWRNVGQFSSFKRGERDQR